MLLKGYATKGIFVEELSELLLAQRHSSNLFTLLKHLQDLDLKIIKCPSVWYDFIATLASPSPVCATIHPLEKLFNLLKMMASDERSIRENIDTIEVLP